MLLQHVPSSSSNSSSSGGGLMIVLCDRARALPAKDLKWVTALAMK